ncbi:unknown [Prevotella sp. CAG:474]|nr:unknown [Prevotella sp. CAG:474]
MNGVPVSSMIILISNNDNTSEEHGNIQIHALCVYKNGVNM